jgi:hypothetical protein
VNGPTFERYLLWTRPVLSIRIFLVVRDWYSHQLAKGEITSRRGISCPRSQSGQMTPGAQIALAQSCLL